MGSSGPDRPTGGAGARADAVHAAAAAVACAAAGEIGSGRVADVVLDAVAAVVVAAAAVAAAEVSDEGHDRCHNRRRKQLPGQAPRPSAIRSVPVHSRPTTCDSILPWRQHSGQLADHCSSCRRPSLYPC